MKSGRAAILFLVLSFLPAMMAVEQKDNPECKDHPMFTRMPGYWIHSCTSKQFDAYAFLVGKGKTQSVEGKFWRINYYPQSTLTPKPSELQILRNFESAITKMGGTLVASDRSIETFKILKDAKEIWVEVRADFTGKYFLYIIQKETMVQNVVADAKTISGDLNASGHAIIGGILFDTGKSILLPESTRAIEEIAKLMRSDPSLKIHVVGHTDNQGTADGNLKLSKERAHAVIQVLVRDYAITQDRLNAFGCGPFAPVASNGTEDGRAKNRRVELVKQ